MLLAEPVEHCLVHWYQQSANPHHDPKYMSYREAISRLLTNGRARCLCFFLIVDIEKDKFESSSQKGN